MLQVATLPLLVLEGGKCTYTVQSIIQSIISLILYRVSFKDAAAGIYYLLLTKGSILLPWFTAKHPCAWMDARRVFQCHTSTNTPLNWELQFPIASSSYIPVFLNHQSFNTIFTMILHHSDVKLCISPVVPFKMESVAILEVAETAMNVDNRPTSQIPGCRRQILPSLILHSLNCLY